MADAIFGFGTTGDVNFGYTSITNLVDNNGTVAADQTALTGTPRSSLAAARFGVDQAIFGFGIGGPLSVSITNLVTNLGVVATDTSGVGTPRKGLAAASYGIDKAIFGYGLDDFAFSEVSITNLVSNLGVVTADQTALTGTPRMELAAAGYGGDKAIFGFGGDQNATIYYSITNLVSATGIVAADVTGIGTARASLAAAGFGGDQAIFGFGYNDPTTYSLTNLVSNTGTIVSESTGVGTARFGLAAAGYGGDKAIFGFGATVIGPAYTNLSMTNLVNNLGVVATDTTGVGTARSLLAAAGLSSVSPTTTTTTTVAPSTTTTTTAALGTTTTTTSAPGLTTTTTTAASTKIQYTLTNTGTGTLTIQSMTFNDPVGVGHIANLVNLGGSSTETGNASLSQLLDPGITKTFTLDYTNTGAGTGTYLGNVIISGSNSTGQTINSTITVVSGTTTTTTAAPTAKAIFGFGGGWLETIKTNLVNNLGVVANDVIIVATPRGGLAAAGYGGDKAIFGYGVLITAGVSVTNLVSDTGVVGADVTGVGTPRRALAAAGYGGDKAIFGFGGVDSGFIGVSDPVSMTNLVDNTGVVATDTTGVGTPRSGLAAAGYGGDKAIFGFGGDGISTQYSITNLVSSAGVVATDTTGVGTARANLAAAGYGGDKAIFGFGSSGPFEGPVVFYSLTNLVNNLGVVATDTTGVGTARIALAATGYGGGNAIFGFGQSTGATPVSITNLVDNTGIVAADVTSVGTARSGLAAAKIGT